MSRLSSSHLSALLLALLIAVPGFAQDAATSSDLSSTAPEPSSTWWRASSLAIQPLPSKVLFHTEATYSFEWKTGNLVGHEQKGDFLVATRFKRLTNYLMYEVDNQTYDVIPSAQSIEQRRYAAEGILRFDLTPHLFADGDLFFHENTSILLAHRLAWYGGLGVYFPLQQAQLSFFAGAGHDDKQFEPMVSFADVQGPAIFLSQTLDINLGPRLHLHQLARLIRRTNETKPAEYNLKAEFQYAVTRHIALLYLFEYTFDRVDIPNVQNRDVHQGLAIRWMIG